MGKFEDLLAEKLEAKAQEDMEFRLALREEFYNTCHDPDTGHFCEGDDGPGRLRDNIAKAEKTLGKKAPTWAKKLLSRRLGKARTSAEKLLPKDAAQYQKDLIKRRAEDTVLHGGDENSHVTRAVQRGVAKPVTVEGMAKAEREATRKPKRPTNY